MNWHSDSLSTTRNPCFGGGEMAERTDGFDWSQTPLGPISGWQESLKIAVRIMLNSRYAMWLGWGSEFTFFYNDAYARMTLGPKHPWALGRPAREVWSEIWNDIGPRAESVVRTGQATWDEGLLLFLERRGFREETYHTFSYSPIPDDAGGIGGMLCVVIEDTERTIGERRLRTLRELAARTNEGAKSAKEACQIAAQALAENKHDLSFALIYLLDSETARLAGAMGLSTDSAAALESIDMTLADRHTAVWPLNSVLKSAQAKVVTDLPTRFGPLPGGAWPESTEKAIVLPITKPGQIHLAGFLVAGISPRQEFNDKYKGFLDLLTSQIAGAVTSANAYEEERRRSEALAELDRAKTAFFSNVSHEFRTPLTLMLGPVEELLARSHENLSPAVKNELEVVNRNGARLLRLVNNLLDFSRIEAGRIRANYQPTNLATFTADLGSVFRSACDRVGLRLIVDCPTLDDCVFIDREMWEKIVLNLLSNAFKFTFEGEIAVSLRRVEDHAELRVRDTGSGIPREEMPRLFERFHRIENARSRTHEGSGIGLALVQELVKLHNGNVIAESEIGQGTTFIVAVPFGSAHLPDDQINRNTTIESTAMGAMPYIEEALRWLPEESQEIPPELPSYYQSLPATQFLTELNENDDRPRVLIADDNADMRQYVVRLLAEKYRVAAVPDGEAALAAARLQMPDLVLTDVMMPRLDGFGLIKELRKDPRASDLPIIMLSARAGEESRLEGMEAGAEDYLVKPFSARDLQARVRAHLQIAQTRKDARESLRQGEERLSLALDAGRLGIWDWDIRAAEVIWNTHHESIFGYAPGQSKRTYRDFTDRVFPEDLKQIEADFHRAMEEKKEYRIEHRIVWPDGTIRWVESFGRFYHDSSGQPTRCVGVLIDITQRKTAEETIQASEERYRTLFESMDEAFCVIEMVYDSENGPVDYRFLEVNSTFEKHTGIKDAVGRTMRELVPDHDAYWFETYGAVVATGKPLRFVNEAKAMGRWYDVSAYRVGGSNSRKLGILFTDITARKRTEDDLLQMAAALSDADRRKNEFLATLAHELRNPLAPIRNGLQIMALKGASNGAIEQARNMMDRQVMQLVRLVDDLMDVSRISQGKMAIHKTKVDLAEVLNSAIETSRPLIDQMGHVLDVAFPKASIMVDADLIRLAQVFLNLLNNAAKYSDRNGRIWLTVERQANEVLVSVRDKGIGIAPNQLPHIFEMFTQLDRSMERSQGGLGIGLSLVERILQMHSGSIEAKSDGLGEGSEFIVRLPVAMEASAIREKDGNCTLDTALRILIVDDNRDNADSLAVMLKMMGNDTCTAYDGEQAIDVWQAFQPHVILLDIGLPKIDGYEACRVIRRKSAGNEPIIIAQTGWGQSEDRQRSQAAGFDYHMVKPIDSNQLTKLLAQLSTNSK